MKVERQRPFTKYYFSDERREISVVDYEDSRIMVRKVEKVDSDKEYFHRKLKGK